MYLCIMHVCNLPQISILSPLPLQLWYVPERHYLILKHSFALIVLSLSLLRETLSIKHASFILLRSFSREDLSDIVLCFCSLNNFAVDLHVLVAIEVCLLAELSCDFNVAIVIFCRALRECVGNAGTVRRVRVMLFWLL